MTENFNRTIKLLSSKAVFQKWQTKMRPFFEEMPRFDKANEIRKLKIIFELEEQLKSIV